MAWTAPRTWTAGEVVTAAHMNEQIRDNENVLRNATGIVNTPAGGIAATDVQAAINELDTEKAGIADAETISADWLFATDKKIGFRDITKQYIHSAAVGFLDMMADTAIRLGTPLLDVSGEIEYFSTKGSLKAKGDFFSGSVAAAATVNLFTSRNANPGNFMAIFFLFVGEGTAATQEQTFYYKRVNSKWMVSAVLDYADITGPVTPGGQTTPNITFTQSFAIPVWTVQFTNNEAHTLYYYGWAEQFAI